MEFTKNYNLNKPTDSNTVDIQDLNENMDILDAEVAKKAGKTYVDQEIASIPEVDVSGKLDKSHVVEPMPHQFTDGAKTYKWGFRTKNGKAQFIYEEVL